MADVSYISRPTKRKVWVLNRHPLKDYKEEYRGDMREIPAAEKKDPSKNLFDLIMAEKFLSKPTVLQEYGSDGVTEIRMGKPLYIKDLTIEEMRAYDPKSLDEQETDDGKYSCTICGETLPTVKGLSLHTKRKHPEYTPVKEL